MAELYPVMAEKIANGGEVTFRVSGRSMQPMVFNRTDTVTLKKHCGKLKKYDLPYTAVTTEVLFYTVLLRCKKTVIIPAVAITNGKRNLTCATTK